jgi:hypothetical protein
VSVKNKNEEMRATVQQMNPKFICGLLNSPDVISLDYRVASILDKT